MKNKSFWYTLNAIIFSCLLIGCKEPQIAEVGQQAPDIAVFDLQGNKIDLAQYQGKKVLINFWSGNCGVCVSELKTFEKMATEKGGQTQILAINIDGENVDTKTLIEKRKINLPIVKDQMKITGERYGVLGTPTSFVIAPDGIIQAKFEGLIPEDQLKQIFEG